MKFVFAGKFENALVRSIDDILQPQRNASTHEYYAGLNRKVPKSYFGRCGTFIAISDEILVPQIDWGYPIKKEYRGELKEVNLGIESTPAGGREWDEGTRAFVKLVMSKKVLSSNSCSYISTLSLSHYRPEDQAYLTKNLRRYSQFAADHYLNRLFLQLKAAREANAFLIVAEEDIQILSEIEKYVSAKRLPTPFEIPDLQANLLEPDAFCNGLLNFSPPDIFSVAATRSDASVREYASKIGTLLAESSSNDREQRILAALVEAHRKSKRGAKVKKVFEVGSWVVKPLHYVPIVAEVLSGVEDTKDLAMKWVDRKISHQEWYLLGVRMKDIAIKDYLSRKANMIVTT
jgi:hypothetical protein